MLFSRHSDRSDALRVIIIGAGEVGYHIAQRLAGEDKQVVVIDQDPEALRRIEESMDVQTILGSGSSPGLLREAGLDESSIVLAVTDSDDINLIACLFANAIAPKAMKLARIRNEEYTAHAEVLRSAALNISLLVSPEEEIVRTIDRQLSLPGAVEYGELAEGRVRVVGMRITSGPLLGAKLMGFRDIVGDPGIMVGGIVRGKKLIVPSGCDEILADDLVYFVYLMTSQRALLTMMNRERAVFDSVCIIGGGNIGLKLARRFEAKNIAVKLIEKNADRCEQLADQLNDTLVLHGDGTDKRLLEEESVATMGAVVAVTGDEETNILSCLLSKSLGVRETVARVNKAAYLPLVEAIGIDHSVSPRLSAVNSILHYIRPGGIMSSVSVGGDAAEVLEAVVAKNSDMDATPVHSIGLPKGALLLAIVRGQEAFIPSGHTVVQAADRIVVLIARSVMTEVEQMLTRVKD